MVHRSRPEKRAREQDMPETPEKRAREQDMAPEGRATGMRRQRQRREKPSKQPQAQLPAAKATGAGRLACQPLGLREVGGGGDTVTPEERLPHLGARKRTQLLSGSSKKVVSKQHAENANPIKRK